MRRAEGSLVRASARPFDYGQPVPGALLPERPPADVIPPPSPDAPIVSGKRVVLSVFAFGVVLVLGVGLFAALTRPPRPPSTAPASSAPHPTMGF